MPKEELTISDLKQLKTLTINQASRISGLDRHKLDQAVRQGKLRKLDLSGATRVRPEELDRYLENLVL